MNLNLNIKKYIAEFIGTFVLVFVACGTAIVTGADTVATALAFGLVIVAMAYTIGNISGCHINPAVSVAMFLNGKLSLVDLIGYCVAQFAGATVASFVHFLYFDELIGDLCSYGANRIMDGGDAILTSLTVEIILTFIFVLVILVVTAKPELSNISGLLIGLTLTLVHLFGIGMTGTSVNPARSFGPALFATDAIGDYWLFLIAPLIGGVLAAFTYIYVFKKDEAQL